MKYLLNFPFYSTGLIWSRYSLVIIPKNWSLFAVNFFVGCAGGSQLFRIWRYALVRIQLQLSITQEFINAARLSLSVQQARGTKPFRKHYRTFFATLLVSQLTGSKTENIFSLARAALNRLSSSWIKGFLSRAAFLKNCFLKETLGVFWLQYWPGMWQT